MEVPNQGTSQLPRRLLFVMLLNKFWTKSQVGKKHLGSKANMETNYNFNNKISLSPKRQKQKRLRFPK